MIKKEQIKTYLKKMDEILCSMGVTGELCLYGGSVMCLVYNARPSTKDVDAIFEPAQKIREAVECVAEEFDLRKDWLNDAVKGFLVSHPKKILFNWPNLKVYRAEPEYLLAMKALASRVDGTDKEDILFLIKELDIKSKDEVFNIIEEYYPRKRIKPVTQFFIEELFEK
ncbi:MAG: DUF6036 family nucleotidyltransferase [bacterium]|nr:DUF6036 family nucleotidyltransferase [bacterium]